MNVNGEVNETKIMIDAIEAQVPECAHRIEAMVREWLAEPPDALTLRARTRAMIIQLAFFSGMVAGASESLSSFDAIMSALTSQIRNGLQWSTDRKADGGGE